MIKTAVTTSTSARMRLAKIASPDPRKLAQWYVDHLEFIINFEYGGNYFVRASNGTLLERKYSWTLGYIGELLA